MSADTEKTVEGTVTSAYGLFLLAQTRHGLLRCTVRESLKTGAESKLSPVVVGDRVEIEMLIDPARQKELQSQKPHGVINKVFPRSSKFSRPKRGREDLEQIVAANIDQMLIISSLRRPQLKLGLIDRFLIAAHQGSLRPHIIINKIDLEHKIDIDRLKQIYSSVGVPLVLTSAVDKIGLEELALILKDKHSIILGQSGVGKSSLLNALDPNLNLRVGEISEYSQKGIHTTTAVEMFPLSFGGYVVDTPGLKYLGLWNIDAEDIRYIFPEIDRCSKDCRFRNCMHRAEPGCGVKKALENGDIFGERYESYLKIVAELEANKPY